MGKEKTNEHTVSDSVLISELISEELRADLGAIATSIDDVAQRHRGNGIALLALLRVLEASHREVCDDLFQEALPQNRQQLYNFLKDIEAEGGWPYIPRMKLRSLIILLDSTLQDELKEMVQPPSRQTET